MITRQHLVRQNGRCVVVGAVCFAPSVLRLRSPRAASTGKHAAPARRRRGSRSAALRRTEIALLYF